MNKKFNILNIKEHAITFLVSLIFFPVSILGQLLGGLVGEFFVYYNNTFSMFSIPSVVAIVSSHFISGYIAGYSSGFVINKIYKKSIIKTALAFPVMIMSFAILGDISYAFKNGFDLEFLGHIIRNPVTILIYWKTLNDLR
jgi:hypothetical protein